MIDLARSASSSRGCFILCHHWLVAFQSVREGGGTSCEYNRLRGMAHLATRPTLRDPGLWKVLGAVA